MFFRQKVSDADPNTATSVAPAATLKQQRKLTYITVLGVTLTGCMNYLIKNNVVPVNTMKGLATFIES